MTPRDRRRRRPSPRLRSGRAPLPVLVVATLLLLAGGSGLFALAASSGPAGADTGNSGSGTPTLGGYTITSLAEAITAQYEQPNFPLPATPSAEFDEGYASTSDNFGPDRLGHRVEPLSRPGRGQRRSGALAPGARRAAAAGAGLAVQATSEYPQTPNTSNTDEVGVNMDTQSSANGNTASATLGDDAPTGGSSGSTPTAPSGSGNPLASSSSLVGVGTMSATSSSSAPSTTATADATATDSGVSLLGGFITIGSVTSTATASSDGTTGTLTGSTEIQNMDIAGVPVTVDANGIAGGRQRGAAFSAHLDDQHAAERARDLHVGHQRHRHHQGPVGQPHPPGPHLHHRPEDARQRGQPVRLAVPVLFHVPAPGRIARRPAAPPRIGCRPGELDRIAAVHGEHGEQRVELVRRPAVVFIERGRLGRVHGKHWHGRRLLQRRFGQRRLLRTVGLVVLVLALRHERRPCHPVGAVRPRHVGHRSRLQGHRRRTRPPRPSRRGCPGPRLPADRRRSSASSASSSCADGDPLLERFAANADELADFGGPSA